MLLHPDLASELARLRRAELLGAADARRLARSARGGAPAGAGGFAARWTGAVVRFGHRLTARAGSPRPPFGNRDPARELRPVRR